MIRKAYLSLIYFFLYLPLGFLILQSFNTSAYSFQWLGFTWEWYNALLQNTTLMTVAWRSLYIGILSASLATVFGILAAITFYRYRFKGRLFLLSLIFSLIVLPDIVLGVALMALYTLGKLNFGFWTLLFSHTLFSFPFVVVTLYMHIKQLNKNTLEAAMDLGATEVILYRTILLPLLKPSIIVAWLIAFTLSLDDVIISFFVTGPEFEVLPLYIFSLVRMGVTPEINALCTVMIGVTLCLLCIVQFYESKNKV